jgi:hypothetical protein
MRTPLCGRQVSAEQYTARIVEREHDNLRRRPSRASLSAPPTGTPPVIITASNFHKPPPSGTVHPREVRGEAVPGSDATLGRQIRACLLYSHYNNTPVYSTGCCTHGRPPRGVA